MPCITLPSNLDSLSVTGSGTEPTPEDVVTQEELTAITTRTAHSRNWSSPTWMQSNELRQGCGSTDRYAAVLQFDIPGNATIKSAMLSLHRSSGAGKSTPVAVYMQAVSYLPGSNNFHPANTGVYLGEIAKGETAYFASDNLVSLIQSISTGSNSSLVLYAYTDNPTGSEGRYSTNWARFDGKDEAEPPTLTIVYT